MAARGFFGQRELVNGDRKEPRRCERWGHTLHRLFFWREDPTPPDVLMYSSASRSGIFCSQEKQEGRKFPERDIFVENARLASGRRSPSWTRRAGPSSQRMPASVFRSSAGGSRRSAKTSDPLRGKSPPTSCDRDSTRTRLRDTPTSCDSAPNDAPRRCSAVPFENQNARIEAPSLWRRAPRVIAHRTSTFLNCHGSLVSISSGKNPGRSVSGVQSV
jgi:hypothetical protein